ncbi:glycosyltransferase family 2 protein [uncultured Imperialibacter sp.]|uniref:glycosyltransferase family 2 protein n=1 Tax=uncultured Imperialibacter sp. TaxID=1672639 RepID=UPI0030D929EE|tara:strand:- start:11167 stop:12090 length:924 start_codon:yes stop_codon:yes gene_type:complete
MRVSVIVPTYNGCHKLERLLPSLESQTFKNFETIVVVDGSTDGTRAALLEWSSKLDDLKVFEQKNRGRAGARNTGAKKANGDLLVFFDDDLILEPGCLEAHVTHQGDFPGTIGGGRQVIEFKTSDSYFHKYRSYLSRKWEMPLLEVVGPVNKLQPFFTAANFSIPRLLFEQLGGFNESLTDAEDQEMAIRADQSGVPIYYLSKAVAYHVDELSIGNYIKRLRQYRKAHLELLTRLDGKNESYLTRAVPFSQPVGLLRKIVYRFFGQPFFLRLSENDRLMGVLPESIRHKFFDWVTTAYGIYHTRLPL